MLLAFELNRTPMEVAMQKVLIGLAVLLFLADAVSAATCPQSVEYVLGVDHNLWRERSDEPLDWNVNNRQWVDGNAAQFQALWCSSNIVYVLGTDGKLWREPGV
jgi:hypothetical protein